MTVRRPLRTLAAFAALLSFIAPARADDAIRIGVLTDMSGPYADIAGRGSVAATELTVSEFGGSIGGHRIEIMAADHQNKPDIGSATAQNDSITRASTLSST